MSDGFQHLRWNDLPTDRPMPRIDRRRIIGSHIMVSEVLLQPGFEVPTHAHENEQFVVMLRGRCVFSIGAEGSADRREIEVRGGEVLVLPPNLPHSCRAIEEASILDLFSPPSQTTGVDRPLTRESTH
jgi:quercetin dioxygenase-like cupin family protein